MAQLISLSDEDLAQLRTELAAGRPPMVWFTSAAVGVPAGGSAKIVAFADTAEGDFIQVRPTGSKDVLSFSPSELTRTRPPRRKAASKPTRAGRPSPRTQTAPVAPRAADPPTRAADPEPPAAPAQPPEVRPTVAKPARPARSAATPAASEVRPAAPVRRGRPVAPAEVIVTLTSSESGDWTVEVVVGKKRTVRPVPVAPADVAKAARALPTQVADAVDRALESARRQQQDRVARLEAELAQAQRALKDLG
ncbi:MAG TPA: DUF6319 family protein [Actinophytocola sp.]|uniref:DUF6319 family protein n=1 Tax=Actinophytocola sp. TaxID=1872138 RepID=UPI002DFF1703|nr:DUF6319 family protein [Actinophytocola sp.]